MQSARLIHFEGLHLDAGCDHIGTVRQGIQDIAVRPSLFMFLLLKSIY